MEHQFIKSTKYVNLGLAALSKRAVLPNVFKKIGGGVFAHALNDTITWRTNRVTRARDYEWRTRTAPIILDRITQTVVDIKLDTHIYQGVPLTDEQMTLDVANFATEIVSPQVDALIDRAESKVMLGLRNADFKTPLPAFYESDDPYRWALNARAILNSNAAPKDRVILAGAGVEAWLLQSQRVASQLATIENSNAIREATLGRLAGMDIIVSPALMDDEVYVVTRDALIIANVAPSVPRGVTDGARARYQGWDLRHIFQYDKDYLQDASVLSTFLGVNSVNDELEWERDATSGMWQIKLDGTTGEPIATGKNVRGTKGTLLAGNRPPTP